MKLARAVPILPILIAGSVGLSCADIASPSRGEAYEWRFITSTGPGTADTLSFHWPQSRLPVKVWTEDTLNLPAHVQDGIDHWKAAFLYGEFDAVPVSDSSSADIIVRAESPSKVTPLISWLGSTLAPECEGGTDILPLPGSREIRYPVRVFLFPRFDPSSPGVDECLALTATHELGHAIGIFTHSSVETDIMYFNPVVSVLSISDRATIEQAYHVEPNLTVPAR
jgi:hypothetical protein